MLCGRILSASGLLCSLCHPKRPAPISGLVSFCFCLGSLFAENKSAIDLQPDNRVDNFSAAAFLPARSVYYPVGYTIALPQSGLCSLAPKAFQVSQKTLFCGRKQAQGRNYALQQKSAFIAEKHSKITATGKPIEKYTKNRRFWQFLSP